MMLFTFKLLHTSDHGCIYIANCDSCGQLVVSILYTRLVVDAWVLGLWCYDTLRLIFWIAAGVGCSVIAFDRN